MSEGIKLQVGVKVLLKNREGKYLLLRRNPQKYPEIGPKWDISGGRIDPGSALIDNLKREVKEETGLVLTQMPKLVAAQDILVRRYSDAADNADKPTNIHNHVVRLTYAGEIEGDVKLDEESVEYKWFTADEIYQFTEKELDSYFKELLDLKTIKL